MKEQLLSLLELQKVDSRILEIRQAMEALPAKLAPAKRDLAKLEALLQQEKDQLAETERWRNEQEELMRREEEAVKQAKGKLQASKDARDFTAASREIENKRRTISEREDEVLKVIDALESTRSNIDAHEKDVQALRQKLGAEEEEITAKVKELEVEVKKHDAERGELAEKIPRNLLKRYEMVLKARGIAVVPAREGACQGCHMALPPQLYNELARFESVESCPNCQRLLFRGDLLEEAREKASENG